MIPDIKHPAYHKDNRQSQQKEDHTAQSMAVIKLLPRFLRLALTDARRSRAVTARKPPPSRPISESW